jgi:hypothetical protein
MALRIPVVSMDFIVAVVLPFQISPESYMKFFFNNFSLAFAHIGFDDMQE